MAYQGLHRSNTFLGDYFRRMKARMGTPKAMTATARKLARIVYHMVKHNRSTTRRSFKSTSNADGNKDQQDFTPTQGNPDSSLCPSMLFLRRAGELPFYSQEQASFRMGASRLTASSGPSVKSTP